MKVFWGAFRRIVGFNKRTTGDVEPKNELCMKTVLRSEVGLEVLPC